MLCLVNHSPPRTEHHGPSARELKQWQPPQALFSGGEASPQGWSPPTVQLVGGRWGLPTRRGEAGPGAACSHSPLSSGILLSHPAQGYEPEPSQHPIMGPQARPPSLPVLNGGNNHVHPLHPLEHFPKSLLCRWSWAPALVHPEGA